jgi:hypothetical protein
VWPFWTTATKLLDLFLCSFFQWLKLSPKCFKIYLKTLWRIPFIMSVIKDIHSYKFSSWLSKRGSVHFVLFIYNVWSVCLFLGNNQKQNYTFPKPIAVDLYSMKSVAVHLYRLIIAKYFIWNWLMFRKKDVYFRLVLPFF